MACERMVVVQHMPERFTRAFAERREAIALGASERVVPLDRIAEIVRALAQERGEVAVRPGPAGEGRRSWPF